MTAPYRLYGGQFSPFSQKVASFLRYKGIEHAWIERTAGTAAEFNRYAKLPLLPLLVGADEGVLQDSTPILEVMERRHPEPATRPPEPALNYVAALLEDFADEWLNKALQHYRWSFAPEAAAKAIAEAALGEEESAYHQAGATEILSRMRARREIIGLSESAIEVIEASFVRTLRALDQALTGRLFLFGDRPSCADFALAAQLAQMLPIAQAGTLIRAQGPSLAAWLARMDQPVCQGDFLPLDGAIAGLEALLNEACVVYLPWLSANSRAHIAGQASFEITIRDQLLRQAPQRYSSKALSELRRKRGFLRQDTVLAELLARFGAEEILAPISGQSGGEPAAPYEEAPGEEAPGEETQGEEAPGEAAQEPDAPDAAG